MQNLPDFLVVGPPKTASTSIYFYLSQHPEVFMSPRKETRFFDLHYAMGLNYYSKFFRERRGEKIAGEASPTYSFLPFVACRIKHDLPNTKLIFCFRNPMERAFSGWLMRRSKGSETLSFREALEKNQEQRQHIDFNDEEFEKIWLNDQKILNRQNIITLRTYIEAGMYGEQLNNYKKYFANENIKVILLDDLKSDFQGTLSNLFKFLDVKTDITEEIKSETKNTYNKNRLKPLFNLIGKEMVFKAGRIIPKAIRNKLTDVIKVKQTKPEMDKDDRAFVYSIFKSDIEDLEKLLSKDLSAWKLP